MGFIAAPGPLELMVILVVALIVLGPQKLPEAARSVGRGMRELKESLTGDDDDDDPYDEPSRTVPARTEPAPTEPVSTESASTESVSIESASTESASTDPPRTEPRIDS
jgi:sec-independent protein translocase protein TatA